jgi:hypothetical protein
VSFDWQSTTDPDGEDVRYCLYINRSQTFNPDSTITHDSLLQSQFVDSLGSGTHFWKVKAYDIWGVARWSNETWSFHIFSPPYPFSLESPQDFESVEAPFGFQWQDAFDPDENDTIRYTLLVSQSETFHPDSTVVYDSLTQNQHTDSLEVGDYYWKVRAFDTFGAERWSNEIWGFYVFSSPYSFSLTSPLNLDTVPRPITFTWDDAYDPDPDDTVRYTLLVGTSPSFHPDSTEAFDSLLQSQHTDTLQTGIHHWKVKAYDIFGGETWCAQIWSFYAYLPGDATGDGGIDIGDLVYLVNFLYREGPAPIPLEAGDANCSGFVTVGDVVYLVNYLFRGGDPPGCP